MGIILNPNCYVTELIIRNKLLEPFWPKPNKWHEALFSLNEKCLMSTTSPSRGRSGAVTRNCMNSQWLWAVPLPRRRRAPPPPLREVQIR